MQILEYQICRYEERTSGYEESNQRFTIEEKDNAKTIFEKECFCFLKRRRKMFSIQRLLETKTEREKRLCVCAYERERD